MVECRIPDRAQVVSVGSTVLPTKRGLPGSDMAPVSVFAEARPPRILHSRLGFDFSTLPLQGETVIFAGLSD